ncbi:MAG: ABC transporter, partial [Clostridia bacterium]|nr:ABC transporter [Clostridia bacterium]
MLAIFKKELRSYFTGVIGYVFLVLFLALSAVVFCYTTLFSMSASVTSYFTYMLLFSGIMLPLLTMKSFSEERKTRTDQLLLTSPVSIVSMVLGKFL